MGYRSLAATVSVLMVSILVIASLGSASDGAGDDPQELYPYADAIIFEERGVTKVMHPVTGSNGEVEWEEERISGSSYTAMSLSEKGGDFTLVMTGGTLNELVLLGVDGKTVRDADIRFEMYGGSVDTLRVAKVSDDLANSPGYDDGMRPVNSVTIDLESGKVREFKPTDQDIMVGSMDVTVGTGMTIDRMYTTGEVGTYGDVSVTVVGGTVGYMSNVRSVIGSLTYDIRAGTVYYMCIGTDTEAGSARSLEDLSTAYVTGDVTVHIGQMVESRQVIFGAGLFDTPSKTWDDRSPVPSVAKNVTIDAGSVEVRADTCFLNNNRSFAYHFDNYRAGSTPSTAQMHKNVTVEGEEIPIYGEGGIWEGFSTVRVLSGTFFTNSSMLQVSQDGIVYIDPNGTMLNAGHISLEGNIVNRGTLENNYIIEKFRNGEVVGTVSGDGFVAKSISITSPQEVISVMSADDSVMIHIDNGTVDIRQISAVLGSGSVDIVVPEGSELTAGSFLISLMDTGGNGEFQISYRLTILMDGHRGDLQGSTVTVNMQVDLGQGFSGEVYRFDASSQEYVPVEVLDSDAGSITFVTGNGDEFFIREIPGGDDQSPAGDDQRFEIALLLVLIVLSVAATFYMYGQIRRR